MNVKTRILIAFCLVGGCTTQPPICPIIKVAVLPLLFTLDGRPLLDIQINGKTEHMILDTGAVVTVLTPEAASALGIKKFEPLGIPMVGIGGEQRQVPSTHLTMVVGGWQVMNTLTVVSIEAPGSPDTTNGIDGSIGFNILEPFDLDLDLPESRLSLYLPQDCVPERASPPWPSPYDMLNFFGHPDGEFFAPIYLDDKQLPAIVDTGSAATMIPADLMKSADIAPLEIDEDSRFKAVGFGPGSMLMKPERFGRITIGSESASKPWLFVGRGSLRMQEAVIGDDYLRYHRVLIQNSTQSILFEPTVAPKQ